MNTAALVEEEVLDSAALAELSEAQLHELKGLMSDPEMHESLREYLRLCFEIRERYTRDPAMRCERRNLDRDQRQLRRLHSDRLNVSDKLGLTSELMGFLNHHSSDLLLLERIAAA